MKTIGLIGGMSWESSLEYYRLINQLVKERLGGLHSACCIMYSVDFAQIEAFQREGRWDDAGAALAHAAKALERAGADFIVLCTNTMHNNAEAIEQAVTIPLLHIVDATAERIVQRGIRRVGLLGTRYTMEFPFYRERMRRYGVEVLVPDEPDRAIVNRIIFEELCLGNVLPKSKQEYLRVMDGLVRRGAEGVILGCTEITLLIKPEDMLVPLFDSTRIHAEEAVTRALG
ncbi:aspartate/glutamate racemase family protein [Brevibacillus sp. NL20B1]|jgi:aspartate racemase|uniref:aspartate/glutamate racemase family protein n=1 Tax=Brevibacillus sp. NL20B1 TaxID=2829799 RepID=UPI001B936EE1|nr:aspartate/glutamate racemase family protein [Brevibacillus sp. NL20B1]MBR8660164.1 aspartate/glutamate racemase family protein [Brevibacillus sp. NL20B1]